MKVVGTCTITGRGDAVFTDQPFSWPLWEAVRSKTRIRIIGEGRTVELAILGAEAALKSGGEDLAFLVRPISGADTKQFIVGREIELA